MKVFDRIESRCLERVKNSASRRLAHIERSNQEILEIPIADCVHYCGCSYGGREYNPYESYQIALHCGVSMVECRRKFIDFLRFYRPETMGEAIGVKLSRPYSMWAFPWDRSSPKRWERQGWYNTFDECPDIMTHFCDIGISSVRIDEEFVWLEKVLASFVANGYQPEKYGVARVLELKAVSGGSKYLLLDGNHRAGAITALSCSKSIIARRDGCVREDEIDGWPTVRNGLMDREDASKIFKAYFRGHPKWPRSKVPAAIIGPKGWKELYLE